MKENLISIIVPVYNEAENINKFLDLVIKTIRYPYELLICYDSSSDSTIPKVKIYQKKFKSIKLVKNIYGFGVLNAIKSGINKSKGDFLVIIPADLSDDPKTINKMYLKMLEGYDIVGATRFSKGGKKIGGNIIKSYLARLAGISTPLILGIPITDLSNGFKMYKKNVFKKVNINSNEGWVFTTEIIIKSFYYGFKLSEVPAIWRDRVAGKSNFKLRKWLPGYLYWYIWGIKKRLNFF
jgi:dolichol-phosphate mannosyltransferase